MSKTKKTSAASEETKPQSTAETKTSAPAEDKKDAAKKAPKPQFKNPLTPYMDKAEAFCNERIFPTLARFGIPDMFLMRFIGVFMFLSAFNILHLKEKTLSPVTVWKEYLGAVPESAWLPWMLLGFVGLTLLYYCLPQKFRVADHIAMFSGTVYFAYALMWRNNDYYLAISVAAVAIVFVAYVVGKLKREQFEAMSDLPAGIIVFGTAAAVTFFVSLTTVAQHRVFGTSTFDFGIFVQMFHSMANDFTAVTSCERDKLLSHFYVHASYIYYLFAPFYALFPNENTLLIGQAILAMGGIIPLFMIARKHEYKGLGLVAVCMIYIFYTGILGPCYYSFHENAFLPTLLMWTIYAMDQRKYKLFYLMSFLVCMVKEDAPLYIICIAMYLFFNEKSRKRFHGLILAAASAIYFVLIMDFLVKHGDGQMMTSSRFGHLMVTPEDGFGGMIKNVLLNPAYFFSLFVQEDTLLFFLQTMIPLLFLPFVTTKIERYLLMIPYIIMNLVVGSDYGYAANMGYQYIFGPACLLIYMLIINCDDMDKHRRNVLASAAAVTAFITCITMLSGKIGTWESYKERKDYFQSIEDCLDTIPEDGSVAINTWLLPHAADRAEVYILDGNDYILEKDPATEEETFKGIKEPGRYDFFVLRTTEPFHADVVAELQRLGFTEFNRLNDYMVIYVSPQYIKQ